MPRVNRRTDRNKVAIRAVEHVQPRFERDVRETRGFLHAATAPSLEKFIASTKGASAKETLDHRGDSGNTNLLYRREAIAIDSAQAVRCQMRIT
jgi:hypothetical protein